MYVIRNGAEVTLGRSAEFEALNEELSAIQQQGAGFVGATLLQSYANPGRYTRVARWTDRAAAGVVVRSEPFTSFASRLLNSGLLRPTGLAEAYESVFEVDRPDLEQAGESTAERLVDFTLTVPMVAPAFEAAQRQLAEVSTQRAPGIGSVRLRRSMGFDTRYLLIVIATDQAAARGWLLTPEVRALTEQQAFTQYLASSPSGEIYHVVKRYVGSPQAAAQMMAAGARP
jgi:heme-degrading monooxygenase HmoA